MKKLSFLLVVVSIVLFSACGNNQGKKKEAKETKAVSTEEQYITADLKIKLDSLVASLNELGMIPIFLDAKSGKIVLTEKEKMVKPNYLLPFSAANNAITLSQKYRAVMMYRMDQAIAELYGMPTDEYKQVIAKLIVDINNPNFTADFSKKMDVSEFKSTIKDIYTGELENGSVNFFWEAAVAAIVEQIYILTQNIDKFIICFDDKAAYDITYRFIMVHDGISSLIQYHPEMASLDKILEPLYVINAINVQQLRDQLLELKGAIEEVRASLLK